MFAFVVIGLWLHFAFVPVEGGTSFMATRTAAAAQVQATRTQLPTSSFRIQIRPTSTPRGELITSVPRATSTPNSTGTRWWEVHTFPTLAPTSTDFPWVCRPGQVGDPCVLTYLTQGVSTDVYYNRLTQTPFPTAIPTERVFVTWTPSPDFTRMSPSLQAQVQTVIASIQTATAQAAERSEERFSDERVPHAQTPEAQEHGR